ncbi:MAG: ABC transporter permease [Spirochaetota bacterium]
MRYAFFISNRYMFSNNKKSIVSKITTIAIITTALSIMMPLIMLSIMNGFHDSIISALMENEFHIKVLPYQNLSRLEESKKEDWYENHINKIKEVIYSVNNMEKYKDIMPDKYGLEKLPELSKIEDKDMIQAVVPYVEGEGLIKTTLEWKPVMIRGFTTDINESKSFKENIYINAGKFDFKKDYKIMLGKSLADDLEINIDRIRKGKGQFVDIVTDIGSKGNISPRLLQHQVTALFTSGYMDIDSRVIFMTAERAMYMLDKEFYTGIGVKLKHPEYIDMMKKDLNTLLRKNDITNYIVKSGTSDYTNQFRAFEWEKNLLFFVVVIMILAAFLTIFITLNILVINKKEEIGILRSIGANAYTIRMIFIIQGFLIGIVGSIIGIVSGIFLTSSINEIAQIGQFLVNAFLSGLYQTPLYDMFGINTLPGDFNIIESSNVLTASKVNYVIYITDMIIVLSGAIFTSLLAAYFPSSRAAKKNIVEVLRYE